MAHYLAFGWQRDFPDSLMDPWNSPGTRKQLQQDVVAHATTKEPLSEITKKALRWRPTLVATFAVEGLLGHEMVRQILMEDERAAFRALVWNYTFMAPLIERELCVSPESSERLLRFSRARTVTLLEPEEVYWSRFAGDPNRELRMTPASERPALESAACLAFERRMDSPAWAYCYLELVARPHIDPLLLEVLARDEEYSLLALHHLTSMGYPYEALRKLAEALRSPRWAFHALEQRLLPDGHQDRKTLLARVFTCPAWTVELFIHMGWKLTYITQAMPQIWALCDGHVLLPELADWHRLVVSTGFAPKRL